MHQQAIIFSTPNLGFCGATVSLFSWCTLTSIILIFLSGGVGLLYSTVVSQTRSYVDNQCFGFGTPNILLLDNWKRDLLWF